MQLLRVGNQRVSFEDKRGERETERDGEKGQPLQAPSSPDRWEGNEHGIAAATQPMIGSVTRF